MAQNHLESLIIMGVLGHDKERRVPSELSLAI